jgi:hypothetical protein
MMLNIIVSREARNEKIKGTKRLRGILVVCVSVLRCAFVCLGQVCAFVCVRGRGVCYFGGYIIGIASLWPISSVWLRCWGRTCIRFLHSEVKRNKNLCWAGNLPKLFSGKCRYGASRAQDFAHSQSVRCACWLLLVC